MNLFSLEQVFKSEGLAKGNFLSRIFGLFNEEPIRFWAEMESTPYDYLGRPTLYPNDKSGWTTLDFAFRRKNDGCVYVAEMKCEIAYQNFRYMTLTGIDQVQRHIIDQEKSGKKSFARFIEAATKPHVCKCKVTSSSGKKHEIATNGAILVWGDVSNEGRELVIDHFGFEDVLSVQDIVNELIDEQYEPYLTFVNQRANWCQELFSEIVGS